MTASRITETLYVGDWQDAKAVSETDPRITIITVAVDSPFRGRYKFDLVDGPAPSNEDTFKHAVSFVTSLGDRNIFNDRQTVLVHCVSGISRSCAVVAGYLMESRKISYDAAIVEVRKSRPIANPAPFFVDILKKT